MARFCEGTVHSVGLHNRWNEYSSRFLLSERRGARATRKFLEKMFPFGCIARRLHGPGIEKVNLEICRRGVQGVWCLAFYTHGIDGDC